MRREADLDAAGVRAIGRFNSAMMHALREPLASGAVLDDWQTLATYLRIDLGPARVERARVLFLDASLRLLGDDVMWTGTIDQVAFHPREVIGRAIEHGASALILVHNHPSGSRTPSKDDVRATEHLAAASRPLGIKVVDHLVVADDHVVSMRSLGLF